ncbi:GAF domain-containing protein [Kibdelosporangium banguiense]|uniref:GAF domain-containing protein n=1 Tax=Kibdelosporangium banguiense TaxID=1365924 RepID=A0ABS4T778_9PSEU|nr:GAF and ANTAR domain-containing protein [Kibdelosporangium banguiense]MBP2320272.1 GAF domain-containing protein [Kibdelosporangium banguiense]
MDHARLVDTFVELADTMIVDFDMIDFLHLLTDRCVELLEVEAAGLLLAAPSGELQVIASSDERARALSACQLEASEGPCMEAFRTGNAVTHGDLAAATARWPRFAAASVQCGIGAVHAVPMRLRSQTIGALDLFRATPGVWDVTTLKTATAFVDVATIGLLQERAIRSRTILTEQLQTALQSRVVIEQAKGLVAERLGIDMVAAFTALRAWARRNNVKLSDAAGSVIQGTLRAHDLLSV